MNFVLVFIFVREVGSQPPLFYPLSVDINIPYPPLITQERQSSLPPNIKDLKEQELKKWTHNTV